MKTQSPEIQLLRVEIDLKRVFTKQVLQIYQTLLVIVRTNANAERLEMEFRPIRNHLKLIGQVILVHTTSDVLSRRTRNRKALWRQKTPK